MSYLDFLKEVRKDEEELEALNVKDIPYPVVPPAEYQPHPPAPSMTFQDLCKYIVDCVRLYRYKNVTDIYTKLKNENIFVYDGLVEYVLQNAAYMGVIRSNNS